MHVKEPMPSEYPLIRKDQIVFTYLHLAAEENLPRELIKSGSINIVYETIQKAEGSLPLLIPMSEVAGRMSDQMCFSQWSKYMLTSTCLNTGEKKLKKHTPYTITDREKNIYRRSEKPDMLVLIVKWILVRGRYRTRSLTDGKKIAGGLCIAGPSAQIAR